MSRTQVVVESIPAETPEQAIGKYEEIVTRFIAASPTERVDIEQSLLDTFRHSIESSRLNEEDNKASEALLDRVTIVSTILSTAVSASAIAHQTGWNMSEVVSNAASNLLHHSTLWFGSALGLGMTLSVVVALWNVKRMVKTGEKVQSVHDDFVAWDKRFIHALDKAQAAVDRAVEDLCEYFVKREALLRIQDSTKTGVLQYEMGMQMARCMAAVENKLQKFKSLIDKAETTLAVIKANVEVLDETATRQKKRGWLTIASGVVGFAGGIATFVASGGVIPVVVAVLGVVVASAGGCVVYLSHQQLQKLDEVRQEIVESEKQLEVYKATCTEFEERIKHQIMAADEYITEAEKEAQLMNARAQNEADREKQEKLEQQLREARAQNAALAARFGSQSEDQRAILEVLTRYRLEKHIQLVLDMEIVCADDLKYIDDDMLEDVNCKPLIKKKLLRMAAELGQE